MSKKVGVGSFVRGLFVQEDKNSKKGELFVVRFPDIDKETKVQFNLHGAKYCFTVVYLHNTATSYTAWPWRQYLTVECKNGLIIGIYQSLDDKKKVYDTGISLRVRGEPELSRAFAGDSLRVRKAKPYELLPLEARTRVTAALKNLSDFLSGSASHAKPIKVKDEKILKLLSKSKV